MIIPLTFRAVSFVSIVLCIFFCVLVSREVKEKKDYDQVTGEITYLEKKLGNLPIRDFGSYRYIKLNNYNYPFEVYTDDQSSRVDSLKKGDVVTAYFYQTSDTEKDGVNNFLRYLEKDKKTYFKQGIFLVVICLVMILTTLLLPALCYFYYKKGKIPY